MKLRGQQGFTLAELLVSSLLFVIVLSGIYVFFRGQLYAIKSEEARLGTLEGARVGLDFMTREIRNAGYNPTGAAGCGILIAQAELIQVVTNWKPEDNVCGTLLQPEETVTYAYDSADKQVTRDGQPLVENVPAGGFSLLYYRNDGTLISLSGTPPQVAPADLLLIRGISVRITAQVPHPDPWVGGVLSSTLTTYIHRRNP
jgi:type IV pilus assembly protein PilW